FGADPLGARRRPGHRGAISRLTDITALLVERNRGADPRVAPRLDRRAATRQDLRAPLKNNNQITISMTARQLLQYRAPKNGRWQVGQVSSTKLPTGRYGHGS